MSPLIRFLVGLAVFAGILAASPFAIERALRAYDSNYDPYVRPGSVSADGSALVKGINRRLFREVRFDATGVSLRMDAFALSRYDAERFPNSVTGTVRFLRLQSPADAKPGPAPVESATVMAEWPFGLKQRENRQNGGEPGAPLFDVECDIVPLTAKGESDAAAVSSLIMQTGTAWEFDFDMATETPPSNRVVFCYSKAPRSILRGTFLERKTEPLGGGAK